MKKIKLWISLTLVIAMLPVSVFAHFLPDGTDDLPAVDPHVVTHPGSVTEFSYVNPEYASLGLAIDKSSADCTTYAETTVDGFDEAVAYLREQMENRVYEISIRFNGPVCDFTAVLEGAFAHTGVPTQGDYLREQCKKISGTANTTLTYHITYMTTLEQEMTVNERIDELFAQWDQEYDFHNLPDYNKVKIIYDYICGNVVPDNSCSDPNDFKYTAYSALINGVSVSHGYASLFYRMALEAGVDARHVSGFANDRGHGWNIVKLNQKYYYLDAAWDASCYSYGYAYFLRGSDAFRLDHTSNEVFLSEYPIDTMDYNPVLDPDVKHIASGTCGKNLAWDLSGDGTLTISGEGKMDNYYWSEAVPWFNYSALITAAVIDAGVTDISYYALTCCTGIKNITVNNENTYLSSENGVLFNKDKTTLICYPRGNERTSYTVPAGVTKIGDSAFADSRNLTEVVLPDSLQMIAGYAFNNCTGLENVEIPAGVTSIRNDAFFDCSSIESFTVDSANAYFCSEDGVLFNKNKTYLAFYPCGSARTSYVVPAGVTGINAGAFADCTRLVSVELPEGLTMIPSELFFNCTGLTSVTIPASVTEIDYYAFYGCYRLKTVCFAGGALQWKCISIEFGNDPLLRAELSINGTDMAEGTCGETLTWRLTEDGVLTISGEGGMDYFDWCGAPWYRYRSLITNVVIEDGVTTIQYSAFAFCAALTDVSIPVSVTGIEYGAFFGCDALQTVRYAGTKEQWSTIEIANENDPLLNVETMIYEWDPSQEHTHEWGDAIYVWSEDSTQCTAAHTCAVCGEKETETVTAVASSTVAPTCTKAGSSTYTATFKKSGFAEQKKIVIIPAKGHAEEIIPGKKATFTEPGLTDGKKCSVCGVILEEQKEIPVAEFIEGTCGAELTWMLDKSGVLTISGKGEMNDYSWELQPWYPYVDMITALVIEDGVTTIGDIAFADLVNLISVAIPDSVTEIGAFAFSDCTGLLSVALGNSVEEIDDYAFNLCSSLASITIPDSVTIIGGSAFAGCTSLTSIVIPDSVTSLGTYVFLSCTGLESVVLGSNVPRVGVCAFYNCTSLKSIVIPDSAASIGERAFYSCFSLADLVIGNSVTFIGNSAFYGCNKLTDVVIPDSVVTLDDYAFASCRGLKSVALGSGVEKIGDNAFYYCDALTSIRIPDSVVSVGNYAFFYCSEMTSVEIGGGVTSIGDSAFEGCYSLTGIAVGSNVTSIGDAAFSQCGSLTEISVSEDNAYYCSKDGVLFSKDMTAILLYPGGKDSTSYTVPGGVTTIGNYAFYGCGKLTGIDLPGSVTSIGKYAFANCRWLEEMKLPDGLTSIGDKAFYTCSSLTKLVIPSSVTSMGSYAFGNTGLTSVIIPDGVTGIGPYTFSACAYLTSVLIPDSVTSIGDYAFAWCYDLATVWFTGTEEQWYKIEIGEENGDLLSAEIFFNWTIDEEPLNGLNKDSDGVWRYYEDGEVATDFTGFVKHINGKYYFVDKGVVEKTTGLVLHVNGRWYYIKNGVKTDYTGFVKHSDGNYYYVKNGVKSETNGFLKHTNGKYYYVQGGMMVATTGLVIHTNGKYYYIVKGVKQDDFTGLVKHNGEYYYVQKGMMRDDFTGLAKHTNRKFYYVEKGVWTKVTALVPHSNGKLYYVVDGIFDKTYNGRAKTLDGKEYEVVNGIAQP